MVMENVLGDSKLLAHGGDESAKLWFESCGYDDEKLVS